MTMPLSIAARGDTEIEMTRVFDAPCRLIFDAWTKPPRLRRWLGVRAGWSMPVCDVDLRAGGAYRFVWRKAEGPEMGVAGLYREVTRPVRLVYTECFDDPWYPGEGLVSIDVEEREGRTTCTIIVRYETTAARDDVLASPMAGGVEESFTRLDAFLTVQDVTERAFLRHALATLAYRAAKVLRDAPDGFADTRPGPTSRSAGEILAHMGDLFDWARSMASGAPRSGESRALSWDDACARFFAALKAFDDVLASDGPIRYDVERLFQGPVADALTHTGQIGQLRRVAGAPVRGESYHRAPIVAGRVGREQEAPEAKYEFE